MASNPNYAFADFLVGLSQNEGNFVNQTEGVAQVPAQTKGLQVYRALYVDDTWHLTPKLTLNLGLRYELQGTWSDSYKRLSYWDPLATNATVSGCGGVAGDACPGDAFLVGTGRNSSGNNIPMDKKAFSPRLGFAYGADPKTVIRGGYGIFYIPNYVSFGLNPDNDFVNLASTPLHATTDSFVTPVGMLDGDECSYNATNSVFPVRDQTPSAAHSRVPSELWNPAAARTQLRTLGGHPGSICCQRIKLCGLQRQPDLGSVLRGHRTRQSAMGLRPAMELRHPAQLPAGFFGDVAYAGSHGVHLEQYSTNVDQLPDTLWSQGAARSRRKLPTQWWARIPIRP